MVITAGERVRRQHYRLSQGGWQLLLASRAASILFDVSAVLACGWLTAALGYASVCEKIVNFN